MTTPVAYNFSVTRDDIIKRALRLIGALAQGETPTTDQVTEAALALNGLVKAWQADGMPLWAIGTYTVTLVSGTNTYTIDNPKPLKALQAWNRQTTSNVDIPMRLISRQEYNILGNKSVTGNPIQVYFEPNKDSSNVYLFPTPDTTSAAGNTVYIVCQKPFTDFDASTDVPDFPQEWYDAIVYGLATRLAPEYGVPATERKMLWQEMTLIKQDALNFGLEENSLYFQRDFRNW